MKKTFIHLAILVFLILTMTVFGQRQLQKTDSELFEKQVIRPPGAKITNAPYVPGLLVGNTLYLSGSIGNDPSTGELVKGGFEAELRQALSNARGLLKAAGMDLANVVSVQAFLIEMSDYARFNEIYREYFNTQPMPTRTTVAVKEIPFNARVELTMTAVRTK